MGRRIARINELLLQEISRIVLERQHPDVGFITFTGVETTDDLAEAKVFYSVLGTEEEKHRTARALASMRHELIVSMRRLESLKYIPHFHFIYDDTPARAARVHDLIDVVQHEPPVPPIPEEEAPPAPREGKKPRAPHKKEK
jgi:ribosome-binding factor A